MQSDSEKGNQQNQSLKHECISSENNFMNTMTLE